MTLSDKIAMVHGNGFGTGIAANPRLGIPQARFADGPNGVSGGTVFPVALVGAATWDTELMGRYGVALGAENFGIGSRVALAPTINMVRDPRWGRTPEAFGEDPYLVGELTVAEVKGIQSQHVIAEPKHFAAYNQEVGRLGAAPEWDAVDVRVSERALREIYLPAFEAAVTRGGAGAVMSAYNKVNGEYVSQNPELLEILKHEWGFDGFVISDAFFGTRSTVEAANAGLDYELPGSVSPFGLPEYFNAALEQAVLDGEVAMTQLDQMVRRILTSMLRVGVFDVPTADDPSADVASDEHLALAREIAERGIVLLKNQDHALPFARDVKSIAVIGDAAEHATFTQVLNIPFVIHDTSRAVTPLAGITERAGSAVQVTYSPGTLGARALPTVPTDVLQPPSSNGNGLEATFYSSNDFTGQPVATRIDPTVDLMATPMPDLGRASSVRWTGRLVPPSTGTYRFTLDGAGAYQLSIDSKVIVHEPDANFGNISHGEALLTAATPVSLEIEYTPSSAVFGPRLVFGWQPPATTMLADAVAAAKSSEVAVVFVNDVIGEGGDRTSLSLPGDQDALIDAVARANPHTVVVCNTAGPVLMPWLDQVAGVFAVWYPGEHYGSAIAALLFGDVNPSGRLPLTFPATETQGPAPTTTAVPFPANGATADYDEGLLIGYRWYDAKDVSPLFPFGHGLSYTRFEYRDLKVTPSHGVPGESGDQRATVDVQITNTGAHAGHEVVQLYVGSSFSAHEPPRQLKGFRSIALAPGEQTTVTFAVDSRALSVWDEHDNCWVIRPGTYELLVGSSSRDIRAHDTLVLQ